MAVKVFLTSLISVDGTDYAGAFQSAELNMSIAELDATVFGGDTEIAEPGRKSFTFQGNILDDLTDDAINEKFWDLWDQRSKVTIIFKLDEGSTAATNPKYTFTGFITSLPMGGEHGGLAGGTVTFRNSSTLARATSD